MDLTGRSVRTYGICAVGYASDVNSWLSGLFHCFKDPHACAIARAEFSESLVYWQTLGRLSHSASCLPSGR